MELYQRVPSHQSEAEKMALKAQEAFRVIRSTSTGKRNEVLNRLSAILRKKDWIERIIKENERDLQAGKEAGLSDALIDRLRLDEKRILSIASSVDEIAAFPDPVGEVISGQTLPFGVEMIKKRVPLGVVFTIYESRPNVTIDVGALSLKSGNAAILRGGKEASFSNAVLYEAFRQAVLDSGLPADSIQLVKETDRAFMLALLQLDNRINIVVPRGGTALIRFVSANSRIPVVKHDKGVCNLFVDSSADFDKALSIAINAKLQRPSVCNAIENLLIHKDYPCTAELLNGLKDAGAELLGCDRTREVFPGAAKIEDPDEEYATEYLDNRLSVKIVDDFDEVLDFIHKYGSEHSEAIVTESVTMSEKFAGGVDTAAVFINCSTRFHDGGQMGMGAEVGISTQRLHVRGPMGIRDLTTTTYIMRGDGQIRS